MRLEQNLLLFGLEKKSEKLQIIKEMTLRQREIGRTAYPNSAFKKTDSAQIIRQKQERIDEIKRLDQGFESVLYKVLPSLQQNPQANKEVLEKMQFYIQQIRRLEEEISELEKENFNRTKLKNLQKETKEKGILPREAAARNYEKTKKR